MLSTCTEPGCTTYVFGTGPCVQHEPRQARVFVRGRPFVRQVELSVGVVWRTTSERVAMRSLQDVGTTLERVPAELLRST